MLVRKAKRNCSRRVFVERPERREGRRRKGSRERKGERVHNLGLLELKQKFSEGEDRKDFWWKRLEG